MIVRGTSIAFGINVVTSVKYSPQKDLGIS